MLSVARPGNTDTEHNRAVRATHEGRQNLHGPSGVGPCRSSDRSKCFLLLKLERLLNDLEASLGRLTSDGTQSPRRAWDSRRSSAESTRLSTIRAITSAPNAARMQIRGFRGSQEIAEVLDKCFEWNFDIFKLEVLTDRRYRTPQ